MDRHITELDIKSYKGLKDLEIKDLGSINILVGDNNCGKTSVLEAIEILSAPDDFSNIIIVSRQRDRYHFFATRYSQTYFDSFINIFNREQEELNVELYAKNDNEKIGISLSGNIVSKLLDANDISKLSNRALRADAVDEEVKTFVGHFESVGMNCESQYVEFNRYTSVTRSFRNRKVFDVKFLSTIDHIIQDNVSAIIRNKELNEQVIELLRKSFDENIVDLRIIEDEDRRRFVAIDHRILGYMPLSTYGEGIRKVIALMGAVASVKNGILLVDEIETAIHPSAMDDVFKALFNVCKEKNVQLFVTTHNIEALEKMLKYNKNENEAEDIKVITLKKKYNETVVRVLDSKTALKLKEDMGLELR